MNDPQIEHETNETTSDPSVVRRPITLYDVVAGRIGLNGFLTQSQSLFSTALPLTPEEVLLAKAGAPAIASVDCYAADERLGATSALPDSDLLKVIHQYISDYYAATATEADQVDFRTFNGEALLAMGLLLEEATKEALGVDGDMALVEPEGMEDMVCRPTFGRSQISGKVQPRQVKEAKVEIPSLNNDDAVVGKAKGKRRRPQG